jgi:hypothetical protein
MAYNGGVRGLVAKGGERGQRDGDKERRWGCARGSVRAARGLRREGRCGGGRLAWREAVHSTPARCSTPCRPAEHARERTIETK